MDFQADQGRNRKLIQRSFRIFEDQLESLHWIAEVKYRGLRNVSDLVREALQQAIDEQTASRAGRQSTAEALQSGRSG